MTLQDLLLRLEPYRVELAVGMLALPVLTWVSGWLLRAVSPPACRWYLALPLYLATVPGIGMILTVLYLLWFTRTNLFAELDIVLYFGLPACMVLTLLAVRNLMPFERIHGFGRLSGFILLVAVSFAIVFLISRLRFLVGFFGSFRALIVAFLGVFLLLKLAAGKMAGKTGPGR